MERGSRERAGPFWKKEVNAVIYGVELDAVICGDAMICGTEVIFLGPHTQPRNRHLDTSLEARRRDPRRRDV